MQEIFFSDHSKNLETKHFDYAFLQTNTEHDKNVGANVLRVSDSIFTIPAVGILLRFQGLAN